MAVSFQFIICLLEFRNLNQKKKKIYKKKKKEKLIIGVECGTRRDRHPGHIGTECLITERHTFGMFLFAKK